MRTIFKYSQNAPFSLNRSYIKIASFLGAQKKEVIVFDHLGLPNSSKADPTKLWELGPDGSYDALVYIKNMGYRWVRNVEPVEPPNKVLLAEAATNQANILRARLLEIKRLSLMNNDQKSADEVDKLLANDNFDRQALKFIKRKEKAIADSLEAARKAEEARLKEAGIDLSKKGKARGNRR